MKAEIVKIYKKYREIIDYIIAGGLTTAFSMILFYGSVWTILDGTDARQMQAANIFSWSGAVLFSYTINKLFVFKNENTKITKEFILFAAGRLLTLVLDMFIMFLGATYMAIDFHVMKLLSMVLVTVGNYIISKFLIFRF